MKKFRVKAETTNRWTFEKGQVEATVSASSKDWARVGTKDSLDRGGYDVDRIEVREER